MRVGLLGLLSLGAASSALAYTVAIKDTDPYREVCSGMYGGKTAYIEVGFNEASAGQVALVIYEWSDVSYLGVETGNTVDGEYRPKTYICTTSAVRSGLCSSGSLGSFITSLPTGVNLSSTSIFTSALQFDASSFPSPSSDDDDEYAPTSTSTSAMYGTTTSSADVEEETGVDGVFGEDEEDVEDGGVLGEIDGEFGEFDDAFSGVGEGEEVKSKAAKAVKALKSGKRGWFGFGGSGDDTEAEDDVTSISTTAPATTTTAAKAAAKPAKIDAVVTGGSNGAASLSTGSSSSSSSSGSGTVKYFAPISYAVPKTGYYCVGVVPVTLVSSRRNDVLFKRQSSATHAEYQGFVLFHNTFEGELPAVEYPKIGLYGVLSIVYLILAAGWGFLCFQHYRELLPMQYYISGTIIFLVIEMLAQFTYYRYINKHGGGASSIAFLFVIAILNAARNSLSFFLLLIVAMGLSVVTQSLGAVMTRVRLLTGFHFVFGVLYSVGTVEVELDSASLIIVLVLIFPLSITLTAFLMWIIVSLNGTILHLQARKQRFKLQMFQRLWRILVLAVIAVGAFFVVSSISLSNRLDEDYAPRNWRYRWIMLDGSLSFIYLAVFSAIAFLWRPTANNVRFAMSQELAQDEAEAEDYEIGSLERAEAGDVEGGYSGLREADDDEDEDDEHGHGEGRGEQKRLFNGGHVHGEEGRHQVGEESVVFAMGDDSDEEGEEEVGTSGAAGKYKDEERDKDD